MANLIHFFYMPFYILNNQYYIINISFICYLLNINLQIPNKNFSEKSAFEPGLLFFQETPFFELVIFHCFSPNPYTRMCVLTIESLSLFREIVKNHGKLQVGSWFLGFSLIFDFSVCFNYL